MQAGNWSADQKSFHINVKELLVPFLFLPQVSFKKKQFSILSKYHSSAVPTKSGHKSFGTTTRYEKSFSFGTTTRYEFSFSFGTTTRYFESFLSGKKGFSTSFLPPENTKVGRCFFKDS